MEVNVDIAAITKVRDKRVVRQNPPIWAGSKNKSVSIIRKIVETQKTRLKTL